MLLCIFLFFIPFCYADIVQDILDLEFISSASDLNNYDDLHPEKLIQSSNHISGWIDIVGYYNLTKKNDNYYIQGNPINSIIILHSVWSDNFSSCCSEDIIEIVDLKIVIDNTSITSSIDIHLKWHKSRLTYITVPSPTGFIIIPKIEKTYYDEYCTITDTDILPLIYPTLNINDTSIEVVIYNNSISPKTTIRLINLPLNVLSVNYSYCNSSLTYYYGSAINEYTDKKCPYLSILSTDTVLSNGNLSYFNGFVIIPSMNFSEKNLTVVLSDPYCSCSVTNMTVSELPYHGTKDVFSSLFIGIVTILSIIVFGIMYQIKRFSCL